jgi:myo-inositol 2-dehydrogenase/D-chiro-inositol 1-dehydrogenase
MICDIFEAAALAAVNDFGVPAWTKDWREVINSDNVDAVIICSPTDQHAEQLMACARLRKPCFCEKPVSLDLTIIDEVVRTIEENNAFCMVGFNRRFDSNFGRIKRSIASGEIGNLHFVHIVSRDPGPPPLAYVAVSGGLHNDMTIHDFDMARFLVDSEVEEIYTHASCRVDPAIGEAGDIDTSLCVIKFVNGVVVTIDNCRKAVYGYDQRVEAFGTGGMIQTDNRYMNQCTLADGQSVRSDLPMNFFMDRYKEAYRAEIRAFVDAVKAGAAPPCGVTEGRAAARMAAVAKRSMLERRPVRMDEL